MALEILVVEDNADARELTQLWLELLGHSVHVAEDGSRGVAKAREVTPDVAFVDLSLPDFNGFDVARRIRAFDSQRAIHLVALTGFSRDSDRREATSAGFDEFVVKPVARETLERILGAIEATRAR